MLKFLFFIALFYLLSRYIQRLFLPSKKRNQSFNPFQGQNRSGKRDFDQIEDAEYEDLSDKKE
ncbi:MAG TPA: hypothetical protein DEQ34_08205 [Balneolaceae bacterium]|nr:hypothetical protein [Balneolaceae bacterium]|tara:strand:- start:182424 stop:182612 length:189 start_codon:yes stop_codon:yes gene_type:complete